MRTHLIRRLPALLLAVVALLLAACELTAGQRSALQPSADISASPGLFCLGEQVTVEWDGGAQVPLCDDEPNDRNCKAGSGSSAPAPNPWTLARGFDAINLAGSEQVALPTLAAYTFFYNVEWEGWAAQRPYRVRSDQPGRRYTGRVSDSATVEPLGDGGIYRPANVVVCDPETDRYRIGTSPDGSGLDRNSDGSRSIPVEEQIPPAIPPDDQADGSLSACAGVMAFCITALWDSTPWTVSVEGGPTVTLGGSGNPRCTDAFAGYHPDDIHVDPATDLPEGRLVWTNPETGQPEGLGSPCDPNQPVPDAAAEWAQTITETTVAGGTLCAASTTDGNPFHSYDDLDAFNFGTLELQGVSRERCLAALDPDYAAALGVLAFGPTEINAEASVPTCDLAATCGDGTCEPVCEAVDCPEDCDASTMSAQGQGICGDGVVSGGEQCETLADCEAGFTCAAPGTDAACSCVALTLGQPSEPVPGQPIATCGDGTLSGTEQCEADTDCQQGYFCGDPGTNAPCVCIPVSQPQPEEDEQGDNVCDGAARVETYPVYDCTFVGGTTFSYYEGIRCWDESDNLLFAGHTGGPYTVDHWVPFCPGVAEPGDPDDGQAPACNPQQQKCP